MAIGNIGTLQIMQAKNQDALVYANNITRLRTKAITAIALIIVSAVLSCASPLGVLIGAVFIGQRAFSLHREIQQINSRDPLSQTAKLGYRLDPSRTEKVTFCGLLALGRNDYKLRTLATQEEIRQIESHPLMREIESIA